MYHFVKMCSEIAYFTLTLIELFIYAVKNELYTLAEVAILPRQSTTSCYSWENYTFSRSQASRVK